MNKFTSKYCYVLLYTYIAYIQTSRSYAVGTAPMPFLLHWYYVNAVLTTLSLGPYHALCGQCFYYVNFDHVLVVLADLTTLLPRF